MKEALTVLTVAKLRDQLKVMGSKLILSQMRKAELIEEIIRLEEARSTAKKL